MSAPRLFLWSWPALQRNKTRAAQSDPEIQPAIDKLLSDVEAALALEPVTVMSKALVPPSGDKHDYMSMGPYWWPNPDTADGLPYIRKDGEVNPEGESLDRRKLGRMMSAVASLALGWHLFDDKRAAEHGARLLRTWFTDPETKMNPHLEFGQSIPGICDGRGIGIIDTAGYTSLIEAIGLLDHSGAITDMDRSDLLMWMKAYRDWLVTSDTGRDEAHTKNNHGTWYDAQLCALSLYTGDPRIVHKVTEEVKEYRIEVQIAPDGSQPHELARTKSMSYTAMNTSALMNLARYAEHVEVDLWNYESPDGRGLRKAVDFLVPYVVDGERWTWQQIADFDKAGFVSQFQRAAVAYQDRRYLDAIEFLPERAAADRVHLCFDRFGED
jgi:hypothetical protein